MQPDCKACVPNHYKVLPRYQIRGVGSRQLQKHRRERWKDHSELGGTAKASWRLFHLPRDTVSIFIGGEVRLVETGQSRSKNMESRLANSTLCLQVVFEAEYLKRKVEI